MTHHTQPTFPLQKGEPQPRDPIVYQPCTLSTSHFPVLGAPSSPYSCTQGGCTSSPPPPHRRREAAAHFAGFRAAQWYCPCHHLHVQTGSRLAQGLQGSALQSTTLARG